MKTVPEKSAGPGHRQKQPIRHIRPESSKEPELSYSDILCLVDNRKVERRSFGLSKLRSQPAEQVRVGDQISGLQARADAFENVPGDGSLFFRQASLASEARHIAIGFPRLQLPGVHDLLPFGRQEVDREFIALDRFGRFRNELINHVPGCDLCWAKVRFIKPAANRVHGMHFHPFAQSRLVANEMTELRSQRIRQTVGKGSKQNPGIRVVTCQKDRPCRATIVFPVPADPETRAGPL